MRKITKINEIHNILFEALCYLDDFCNKHGLIYYLSNGTLLGAAKYGDFIPWDDDIDVFMPRSAYERLIASTDIDNENYKLLSKERISLWRIPYAKLSCENTIVEEGDYNFGVKFGLNIDIFPIDNWHPCNAIAKMQSVRTELLKRMLVSANGMDFVSQKRGIKRLILYMIWSVGKKYGYDNINKSINKIIQKSKKYNSDNVGCVAWTCHMTREVLSKDLFSNIIFLRFREKNFPVFEGYEKYLDRVYGKWHEELPVEQQHSNHTLTVWSKNV